MITLVKTILSEKGELFAIGLLKGNEIREILSLDIIE